MNPAKLEVTAFSFYFARKHHVFLTGDEWRKVALRSLPSLKTWISVVWVGFEEFRAIQWLLSRCALHFFADAAVLVETVDAAVIVVAVVGVDLLICSLCFFKPVSNSDLVNNS